ncbi:hypothetical protein [Thermomonospora umbrina]|uniref:DUF4190 domain-containing protein n=1 Tax=Thermomonospora umbrina TaxID=111806 RepID=A0A3D9SUZ3_9ACTN|nr:hypothetical protein [Thermomonospora umbrina]REE96384.1 hypothetical protein DFJ69_1814 [Thermomonospora umbrina]
MSGHGEQPAGGWADPYGHDGRQDGLGQPGWDPYARYPPYGPGGPYGHGQGYGPPGVPLARPDNSSIIVALVCNIVATVVCCNFLCIGGVITSSIALSRSQTDPVEAKSLTGWSWVILGVSIALEVLLFAILVMVGALADGSSSSGSGYGGV